MTDDMKTDVLDTQESASTAAGDSPTVDGGKLVIDGGNYTYSFHNDHIDIYMLGHAPMEMPSGEKEFVKLLKKVAGPMCRVKAAGELVTSSYEESKQMEVKPNELSASDTAPAQGETGPV